jgi:nitrite reductase/ring-hydroxylating ferredoxin subunit
MSITRREFMKLTGATVVCACVGGAIGTSGCTARKASDTPPAPEGSYRREGDRVIVSLSEVPDLKEEGGAVKFTLDGEDGSELKVIVVHSEDDTCRAFADRCTHSGKELDYLHEDRKLQCLSGKAQFDLEGDVLRGPAEDALLTYPLRRAGEELVIEV